ncbi:polyenoic fatty acid isomerase-like isoform X2 [Mizuhopecten yessoensis]|uniref:polyenoic fatty acid isomerase-like isoform X2 n=1 Tax=Mizuhopecten yessoensis TaxID=6573 RepID=UPI000B45C395|nr:polyenoic fatty acid isomerase-like isoform X2 [Mizuhopecten yessoensis]
MFLDYPLLMTQEQNKNSEGMCAPTSFPKIKGPKSKHDRIAIIGAGPSGIHMAYKLKKEGYTNVTVFERNRYIGGKSRTLYHRGVPHEMGTVYTQPDYTEIYRLVNEFDAGHLLPMPSPTVWVNNKKHPIPITSLQNSIRVLMRLRPDITNTTVAAGILQQAIRKYLGLHIGMFGTYEGELMPRPCDAILSKINMTFLDFLKVHQIEALKGMFMSAMTAQGYGHVDEISTLYGMMWMTPRFLEEIVKPPLPEVKSVVKILSKGFQFLWAEISRITNLNVKLSSPVTKVLRLRNGFLVIYRDCGNLRKERFDFIITSPTMKFMSNVIKFDPDVRELFRRTFNYYYTTTLADTDYGVNRGKSPQDYYAFNMNSKENNSVWVHRDSYSSLNYITGENYTNGLFTDGPDGKYIQSSVYYQFSKRSSPWQTLTQKLKDHILNVERSTKIKIIHRIKWSYFPRYSVSDMASGILWDIFEKQGAHNMWYIGSSVSFESVKSVVEYNNLLLRQFPCSNGI